MAMVVLSLAKPEPDKMDEFLGKLRKFLLSENDYPLGVSLLW